MYFIKLKELCCLIVFMRSNIHGLKFLYSEIKIVTYADKVNVLCISKKSVSEVASITRQFCSVNWNKCYVFRHGA